MKPHLRIHVFTLVLLALAGCATQGKPPPAISLDEPVAVAAQPLPEPPKPIEVVAVPEPLPLPAQLKQVPAQPLMAEAQPAPEPSDEKARVSLANQEARVAPSREGYVNAIQVWPYADGALYQVPSSRTCWKLSWRAIALSAELRASGPRPKLRPGTLQQVLDRCRLLHDEGINICSALSVTGLP